MAHTEKRISKSGVVSWRVQIAIPGAPRKSATFDRKTDAKRWAREEEPKVRESLVFGTSTRRTLDDAIEEWLRLELAKIAVSDQRNRRRQLEWWSERLGRVRLGELSRSVLAQELADLRAEGPKGRPLTVATVNRYRAALSAVLSAAQEDWEWIPTNPLHRSGRRRKPRSEREAERERLLSAEEWSRLEARLKASGDRRLHGLVVCALASGARQGELLGMEWKRLELKPRTPEPGRQGVPRYLLPETKNGDARFLYFPGASGRLLAQMAAVRCISPYVWARREDAPGKLPEFPRMAFRWAVRKAEIEDFHFHDLRHAWAVDLLDHGATLAQLLILGGWRSYTMIRRYAKRAQQEGGSAAVEAMHQGAS